MAEQDLADKRKKACYVGAPAVFALTQACQHINDAFGDYGCYLVGSAIERPDWRDVDVRYIMPDEEFYKLFPDAPVSCGSWEFNPRWLLLNVSIALWLKLQTGLPIDFQIQPQSHANSQHKKQRCAIGMRVSTQE